MYIYIGVTHIIITIITILLLEAIIYHYWYRQAVNDLKNNNFFR